MSDSAPTLRTAYDVNFLDNGSRMDFIRTLVHHNTDIHSIDGQYYAPMMQILQSSGCGKSTLMREVGYQAGPQLEFQLPLFTIPFNLRDIDAPGWLPSDPVVWKFFDEITGEYDTSLSAHWKLAAFLAATFREALEHLRKLKDESRASSYSVLLQTWNKKMEYRTPESPEYRSRFGHSLVKRANEILSPEPRFVNSGNSPRCDASGQSHYDILGHAQTCHTRLVKQPMRDLLSFLGDLAPGQTVFSPILYFDESRCLVGGRYWTLARLISVQKSDTSEAGLHRTAPDGIWTASLRVAGCPCCE